jgi:hypothetical protein
MHVRLLAACLRDLSTAHSKLRVLADLPSSDALDVTPCMWADTDVTLEFQSWTDKQTNQTRSPNSRSDSEWPRSRCLDTQLRAWTVCGQWQSSHGPSLWPSTGADRRATAGVSSQKPALVMYPMLSEVIRP